MTIKSYLIIWLSNVHQLWKEWKLKLLTLNSKNLHFKIRKENSQTKPVRIMHVADLSNSFLYFIHLKLSLKCPSLGPLHIMRLRPVRGQCCIKSAAITRPLLGDARLTFLAAWMGQRRLLKQFWGILIF